MGDVIQYGTPKLPAPIFRVWLIRCVAVLLCIGLGVLYEWLPDKPIVPIAFGLMGVLLVPTAVLQTLKERQLLRLARRNNLNICANCCTPFDPETVDRCHTCGLSIVARDEQRRWRRAVLISLWNWFTPKPRRARIFPHWWIPLGVGLLWFGYIFLREPIEDLIWPPNTQTMQTFTAPNSGNPPRTAQIPVPTQPPTPYFVVMGVIGMLSIFGIPVCIMIRQSRVTKSLKAAAKHSFLVCERCMYPLVNLDESKCPECGVAYHQDRLRQRWYMAYGLYFKQQAWNMSIPLGIPDQAKPGGDA